MKREQYHKLTLSILIIITAIVLYLSYLVFFTCGDSACSFGESIVCNKDCQPIISKKLPVMVQLETSCEVGTDNIVNNLINNAIREIKTDDFWVIVVEATKEEASALEKNECVIKTARVGEFKKILEELKGQFENERKERFREIRFNRTKKDVLGKEELEKMLQEKHPEAAREPKEVPEGGVMAPYQLYITPDENAITGLANSLEGIEEVWEEALSWVWVSEQTLNGVEEKWLYPEEFLEDTPYYSSNPVEGKIASDCSEQANTLASLLIAEGYSTENVRVVLGLVKFDETNTGGHAWVQYFDGEEWIDMDATMGNYWDDSAGRLVEVDITEIPYWYFKYYEYPVVEVWYYYNNEYFWDAGRNRGNAPFNWRGSR